MVNGKRRVTTLCRFEGRPPASGSAADFGDKAFELSRADAITTLNNLIDGARTVADRSATVERVLKYKYGEEINSPTLADLADAWDTFPRKRKPSAFHRQNCRRILAGFVSFMKDHYPGSKVLADVKASHARAFMDEEEARKISARTWNVTLTVLRGAFAHLDPNADGYRNYLAKVLTKDEDTVHRQPYTLDEMKVILDKAKASDELMFRLIVTVFSSGLRRGDLCQLHWRDVDLKAGFVSVKTNKTGERIEFPVLPLLHEVLVAARKDSDGKPNSFIFPLAAKAYREQPDSLDRRLKKVLALAGFFEEQGDDDTPALPVIPADELKTKALAAIEAFKTEKARLKAKDILIRYMNGQTIPDIALSMNVSKGIVSTRLNEIQNKIGAAIIRRDQMDTPDFRGVTLAPTNNESSPRLKRGSLRGWHSFRTSFITQALSAGIPMELVRRVTGHSTVDVVLKHYFKPGREDFSKAITAAMPKLLGEPEQTEDPIALFKEEAQAIFSRISSKTWRKDVSRMQDLVAALPTAPATN